MTNTFYAQNDRQLLGGAIYYYFVQCYRIFKAYTRAAKGACVRPESSPSEKHYNSSRKAICKDRWGL